MNIEKYKESSAEEYEKAEDLEEIKGELSALEEEIDRVNNSNES